MEEIDREREKPEDLRARASLSGLVSFPLTVYFFESLALKNLLTVEAECVAAVFDKL